MNKFFFIPLVLVSSFIYANSYGDKEKTIASKEIDCQPKTTELVKGKIKEGFSGFFEVGGRKADTKFVRVLYVAEGSEKEGESNSTNQIIYDSKDLNGNDAKVYRFQIVTKSTGYDELQKDPKNGDYKIKKVVDGAKLSIEVPIDKEGKMQLEKAVIGSLAYTFDAGKIKAKFTKPDQIEELKLNLKKLDLPVVNGKPGDRGMVYESGYISLEFIGKIKNPESNEIEDFQLKIDNKISLTHVRGKEKEQKAVSINPVIIGKNVK